MKMINEGFKDYMQNGKMQCSCVIYLKGTTRQHSGKMSQHFQNWKDNRNTTGLLADN